MIKIRSSTGVAIQSARSLIGETVRKLEGYRPYGKLYTVTNEWQGKADEFGQYPIEITDEYGGTEYPYTDQVTRWDARVVLDSGEV